MHEHFWPYLDYAKLIEIQANGAKYRLQSGMPTYSEIKGIGKMNSQKCQKSRNISAYGPVRQLKIGRK